ICLHYRCPILPHTVIHLVSSVLFFFTFFFFNDTATTEIYTLSLHDALPIWSRSIARVHRIIAFRRDFTPSICRRRKVPAERDDRSEEHTSELQSPYDLVCRLLLEKKKKKKKNKKITNTKKLKTKRQVSKRHL